MVRRTCAIRNKAEAAFAYWLIDLHMGRPVPQNCMGEVLGDVRDDGADPKQPGIRLYRTVPFPG
jgi:hypothetical protein